MPLPTRECDNCRKDYTPDRSSNRFCCSDCRTAYHNTNRDRRAPGLRKGGIAVDLPRVTRAALTLLGVGGANDHVWLRSLLLDYLNANPEELRLLVAALRRAKTAP